MSIFADFQVSGAAPSTVGGTGVAIKYFPRLLGPSIGVAPSTPSSASSAGQLLVPSFVQSGQQFKVKVSGNVSVPAGTVVVELYAQTAAPSATPAYTLLAANASYTPGTANKQSFMLEATLYGDQDSGVVSGYYNGAANGVLSVTGGTAQRLINNNLSSINFNGLANSGPFGLVVGVTFGTSAAANAAKLFQFQITD